MRKYLIGWMVAVTGIALLLGGWRRGTRRPGTAGAAAPTTASTGRESSSARGCSWARGSARIPPGTIPPWPRARAAGSRSRRAPS